MSTSFLLGLIKTLMFWLQQNSYQMIISEIWNTQMSYLQFWTKIILCMSSTIDITWSNTISLSYRTPPLDSFPQKWYWYSNPMQTCDVNIIYVLYQYLIYQLLHQRYILHPDIYPPLRKWWLQERDCFWIAAGAITSAKTFSKNSFPT